MVLHKVAAGLMAAIAVAGAAAMLLWFNRDADDPQQPEPAAAAEPAETGDNPLGPTTSPPPSEPDGEPTDDPPPGPDLGAPERPDDSVTPCLINAAVGIQPDSLLLTDVRFEVTGIGGAGIYRWSLCGSTNPRGRPDDGLVGNEGECSVLLPNAEEYLLFLASLRSLDVSGIIEGVMEDVFFTAAVRVHEAEFVGIGHDAEFGITTGGLSTGGASDGSRGEPGGDNEQWTFDGGTMSFRSGTGDGSLPGISDLPWASSFTIEATWKGLSVNEFAAHDDPNPQADATVAVTCEFLVGEPEE